MKKKIAGVITCMLLLTTLPIVTSIESTIEEDSSVLLQMKGVVFGFFPRVSGDNITFLSFPQFRRVTIPKDEFSGYIGIFIIYGTLDSPY